MDPSLGSKSNRRQERSMTSGSNVCRLKVRLFQMCNWNKLIFLLFLFKYIKWKVCRDLMKRYVLNCRTDGSAQWDAEFCGEEEEIRLSTGPLPGPDFSLRQQPAGLADWGTLRQREYETEALHLKESEETGRQTIRNQINSRKDAREKVYTAIPGRKAVYETQEGPFWPGTVCKNGKDFVPKTEYKQRELSYQAGLRAVLAGRRRVWSGEAVRRRGSHGSKAVPLLVRFPPKHRWIRGVRKRPRWQAIERNSHTWRGSRQCYEQL